MLKKNVLEIMQCIAAVKSYPEFESSVALQLFGLTPEAGAGAHYVDPRTYEQVAPCSRGPLIVNRLLANCPDYVPDPQKSATKDYEKFDRCAPIFINKVKEESKGRPNSRKRPYDGNNHKGLEKSQK